MCLVLLPFCSVNLSIVVSSSNQELSAIIIHPSFSFFENAASISSMVGKLDLRFSGTDFVICLSHSATPIGLVVSGNSQVAAPWN